MDDDRTNTPDGLVDGLRAACLCDVGAPGYVAAVTVGPDGDEALWLVSEADLGREDAAFGDGDQPHEQLGRLPVRWRDRLWGNELRCGYPTTSGLPCRHRVPEAGRLCTTHTAKARDGLDAEGSRA